MLYPTLEDYADVAEKRRNDQLNETCGSPSPRVSVVTAVFNGASTIERTIASVQSQTFGDIEHVVVDGGSSDDTLAIVKARLRPCDFWISEPDRGISDAFNKGIALARGRYILFLNADDWAAPEQIERAVGHIEASGADFVFGDLEFHEADGSRFLYTGDPDYAANLHRRMPAINHPTALIRRSAFERVGLFDLRYRCAMDYDWFYRLHRAGGRGVHRSDIVAFMTHDGVSNRQFRTTIREVKEIAVAFGRPRLLAEIEAAARIAKTSAARPIKRYAHPVYRMVRRRLNAAFHPLPPDRRQAA